MRFPALLVCVLLVGCSSPKAFNSEDPAFLTVGETSGFRATARHADVVALLDRLDAASPNAARASMGTTVEGRDIPLLIIADPPLKSAAAARASNKGVVFAFANIHAGEVDGKEALPILARELLAEPHHPLLRHVVVVFAPIYNADGNERFALTNRPGQVGPEEGMGIRENARGFDLNRDFVKLECPETRALVGFLNEWDPHIVIDCHTTNGSYHRYPLTYAGPKVPAGDRELITYWRDEMAPALTRAMDARGVNTFWYGSFEGAFTDAPRGHTRWETFPAQPRYGTNYVGLRNRIGILSEAYSYVSFEERVLATRDFVRAIIEFAAANHGDIRRRLWEADQRAMRGGGEVALRAKVSAWDQPVTVLGYEERVEDGRSVAGAPTQYQVELWDRFEAELAVTRPWAYIIPEQPDVEPVLEKLRLHGIQVTRLTGPAEFDIEAYAVSGVTPASASFQNHLIVKADTTMRTQTRRFERGSYLVKTAQPLGSLAAYLLEPQSEDGLTAWNFFDPWMKVGAEFPVYRVP